jgi:hypothetical protein
LEGFYFLNRISLTLQSYESLIIKIIVGRKIAMTIQFQKNGVFITQQQNKAENLATFYKNIGLKW